MNILLSVDRATEVTSPTDDAILQWVNHTLTHILSRPEPSPELSIRITDNEESARLNHTYRAKSGPTNVLSFPAEIPPETGSGLLGDLVICAPLVSSRPPNNINRKKLTGRTSLFMACCTCWAMTIKNPPRPRRWITRSRFALR